MSKFRQGETSSVVINKKNAITKSILRKSELIDEINNYDDIPSSLEVKKGSIYEYSVHKWHDNELRIISYSRNAAHAVHNSDALNTLITSIRNANRRLIVRTKTVSKESGKTTTRISVDELNLLRNSNEELRTALAEVFRAYMQLIDNYREDQRVDKAYRDLILSQTRILGKNRLREAK